MIQQVIQGHIYVNVNSIIMNPENHTYKLPKDYKKLLEDLEENTAYSVHVQVSASNPMHKAILFFGFKSGAYGEIYSNSYDAPMKISAFHTINIEKRLCSLK